MYSANKYLFYQSEHHGEPQSTDQYQVGFPIRKFPDQRVLSPPRNLSQSATSFIASYRLGIHQTPFSRLIRSSRRTACNRSSLIETFVFSRWTHPPFPKERRGHARSVFLDLERPHISQCPKALQTCDIFSLFTMSTIRPEGRSCLWSGQAGPKGQNCSPQGEQKQIQGRDMKANIPINSEHNVRPAASGGGAYRDRTDDPLLAKQVLSQVS